MIRELVSRKDRLPRFFGQFEKNVENLIERLLATGSKSSKGLPRGRASPRRTTNSRSPWIFPASSRRTSRWRCGITSCG